MDEAYQELRRAGFSFEELAEANLQGMFTWKLGPLLDQTGFTRELAIAQRNLADGPSSLTLGRVQTLATRLARVTDSPSGIRNRRAAGRLPGLGGASLHANVALSGTTARRAHDRSQPQGAAWRRARRRASRSRAFSLRHRDSRPLDGLHRARTEALASGCQLVFGREGSDDIIATLDAWSAEPSED